MLDVKGMNRRDAPGQVVLALRSLVLLATLVLFWLSIFSHPFNILPRLLLLHASVRYLELNSWMWQVNGLNLLVDPLFDTLDFGVPALIQGNKLVRGEDMAKSQSLEWHN